MEALVYIPELKKFVFIEEGSGDYLTKEDYDDGTPFVPAGRRDRKKKRKGRR